MSTPKKQPDDVPATSAGTQTKTTMSVHDALAYIQARLVAPKDARNAFGGYNYRSAEQILAAAKPLLAETGAVLTIDDEICEVAGRIYVRACARLRMPPSNGIGSAEEIRTYAYAREPEARKGMDDAQCTGSSSSYSRKYALCGLFAVDDSRLDPDATCKHEGRDVPAVPVPAKAPDKALERILSRAVGAPREEQARAIASAVHAGYARPDVIGVARALFVPVPAVPAPSTPEKK